VVPCDKEFARFVWLIRIKADQKETELLVFLVCEDVELALMTEDVFDILETLALIKIEVPARCGIHKQYVVV